MSSKKVMFYLVMVAFLAGCSNQATTPDEEIIEDQVDVDESAEPEQDEAPLEEEAADDDRSALEEAVESDFRSAENRARDEYRNPVETLSFFGIKPDMTVVELSPGGGWYSEILGPYLAEQGKFVAGNFNFDPEDSESYQTRLGAGYIEWVEANGDVLGEVEVGTFAPPEVVEIGEAGSADMVVTFRNMHGWYNGEVIEEALAAVYEVLRPGGVFGVVQHRADEGSDVAETAPKGYLPEEFVIEQAEQAGFVLADTSQVNANPRDTKDYEGGVWALPPSLRGDEDQAESRKEIGESDRMTLRFVKPAGE